MTSSPSYLIGKLYTWVPTSVLERYELIAPNNSAIATFPLDTKKRRRSSRPGRSSRMGQSSCVERVRI